MHSNHHRWEQWRKVEDLGKWLKQPSILLLLLLSILTLLLSTILALTGADMYLARRRKKREREHAMLHHSGYSAPGHPCRPDHWQHAFHWKFISFAQSNVALIQHTETNHYHLLIPASPEDASGRQCPVQDIYRVRMGMRYEPFIFLDSNLNGYLTQHQAREAARALVNSYPNPINMSNDEHVPLWSDHLAGGWENSSVQKKLGQKRTKRQHPPHPPLSSQTYPWVPPTDPGDDEPDRL